MPDNLIDGFNRTIDYLRISVTDRCNLRCLYCMPAEGIKLLDHDEILSYEEIMAIAEILVDMGIKKVRITGGEPLVRKQLAGFIKKLRNISAIDHLSITTNGMLLESHIDALKNAGVEAVNISMDSLDPSSFKKITRGGNLETVIRSVRAALSAGFGSVKINTVVSNYLGDNDVREFIRLTMDNPLSVRFIEMMKTPYAEVHMPGGRQIDLPQPQSLECGNIEYCEYLKDQDENKFLTDGFSFARIFKIMKEFGNYTRVDEQLGFGPSIYYRFKSSRGHIGFIFNDKDLCSYCNRIRLTPSGKIRLCLFSDKEFDIRDEITKGNSTDSIKSKLSDFIKTKPENREMCHKINGILEDKAKSQLADYMNRIGG